MAQVTNPRAGAAPSSVAPSRALVFALGAALALLVVLVYAQVRTHEFVAYDIDTYLTENAFVLRGLTAEGWRWAWGWDAGHAANWHPLTWLSHMFDVELHGFDAQGRLLPAGHHLTNVAFHVANTLLVFMLFLRWTRAAWRSALVALLFGLHPMHVESVAWVVERKDVLSAFFGLAFLHAWTSWLRAPSVARYVLAFALLCLGLMAKSMIVTLPCALLVFDVWPLARTDVPLRRRIVEKLPFLAPMIASAWLTMLAQTGGGAVSKLSHIELGPRLANALIAWPTYVWKLVWPAGLSAHYPWRDRTDETGVIAACALAVVAIGAGVWLSRRRAPYALAGWLVFSGMLVPVIGLVQVGDQALADRYTYLPALGVFAALVWGANELCDAVRVAPRVRLAFGVAFTALLAFVCSRQVATWETTGTLAGHAVEVDPSNAKMHGMLGGWYTEESRHATNAAEAQKFAALAEQSFRTAADLKPSVFNLDRLGYALMRQGRYGEAKTLFERALEIAPDDAQVMNHLGGTYDALNQVHEAEEWMRKSLARDASNVQATQNLGWILERQNKFAEAEAQFRRAIQLLPGNARAEWRLGTVCRKTQRWDEAVRWLELALAHGLTPNDRKLAEAELELARQGQRNQAKKP